MSESMETEPIKEEDAIEQGLKETKNIDPLSLLLQFRLKVDIGKKKKKSKHLK